MVGVFCTVGCVREYKKKIFIIGFELFIFQGLNLNFSNPNKIRSFDLDPPLTQAVS